MPDQLKIFWILLLIAVDTSKLYASENPHLLSFEKEIETLLEKSRSLSPDLKIVRNYRSQKNSERFSRFSQFYPQANFSIKKEKDFFEERTAQFKALGLIAQDASWTIDYQWTLLNFGLIQSTRKTMIESDKAQLDVENKEKEYPVSFKTNFLNYLLAQYKKAAVENSLKKAEANSREAKLGFELGQKTKIDVLRAEANTVSLDSKKTSFSDEVQNTKSKLLEYSGLAENDIISFNNLNEEDILSLINDILQKSIQDSEIAFKLNSDLILSPLIKGIGLEEKINILSLASLTQKEWPDLKIQGSYNNTAESFSKAFSKPTRTHTIAVILTLPLFGGGSLISSNFESYFAKKQIQYSLAQKKLETQNQLNNTQIKIQALKTLVSSLSINVSQFEELYRLTLKSYQLGKSSLVELLEVQDNLLESKINLAQSKIQFFTLSQNYLWQAGLQ